MKRIVAVLVMVLALGLLVSGCGTTASNTITVGVAGPMTGDSAEAGQEMANAIKMAVEEFNASGAIKGKTITLDIQDDQGNPNQAAIIAQKFVDEKVTGVIGHWMSGTTAAAIPIYQKGQTPVLAPTPSSPTLIKLPEDSYIFRTADSQEIEGGILADLFVNKLGKKNIAILYSNDDWGIANHTSVIANLAKVGANVVYDKSYTPGQSIDFQAALTAVAAAKPDLFYVGAYFNDAALICRQAREMGIKQTISGSGVDYAETFITLGGKSVEGVYVTTLFSPDSPDPRDKAFIEAFTKEFGKAPTVNASESYEGAKVMFEAIRIGGTDRVKVRAALENMKDFVAFNRPVSFSPTNHNSFNTHYVILQVKDGKFVPAVF
jgi:branched-chain amino acid transport system substrate-binding protein